MKHWFRSRHWTCWHPCSWQGWVLTAAYVAAVIIIFLRSDINSYSLSDTLIRMFIPFIILSILFVAISKHTTENLD
jgi:hypothetical protein